MMACTFASIFLVACAVVDAHLGTDLQPETCPPANFSTVHDFDLLSFVSGPWYIQQQMPTSYLPKSENKCVYAEYSLPTKKSFWQEIWGYDVQVQNHAEDIAAPHTEHDSGKFLCAKVVDRMAGKLEVAPCFLPTWFSGPYWVVAFSEQEGYALISGGAPTISAEGGCRTGTGINNSGLWIFTRQQERDEALVQKVRRIAAAKGFDLSVLNDVDQTGCAEVTLI